MEFSEIQAYIGFVLGCGSFILSFRMSMLTYSGISSMQKLMFWMSISDLVFSLHYIKFLPVIIGHDHFFFTKIGTDMCVSIGVTHLTFLIATQSWYFCLTFELFCLLRNYLRQGSMCCYHFYVWAISIGVSSYCFYRDQFDVLPEYQSKREDCYLKNDSYRLIPIVIMCTYMCFAFVVGVWGLFKMRSDYWKMRQISSIVKDSFGYFDGDVYNFRSHLLAFVAVFIVSWIWTPIDRFLKLGLRTDVPKTIQLLRLIGASGCGSWNYLVWHWISFNTEETPEWAQNLYGRESGKNSSQRHSLELKNTGRYAIASSIMGKSPSRSTSRNTSQRTFTSLL